MKSLLIIVITFIVLGFFYGLTRKSKAGSSDPIKKDKFNNKYDPYSKEGRAGKWRAQTEGDDPSERA
jgi:hypothetical protein